jgi:hypothetical protein
MQSAYITMLCLYSYYILKVLSKRNEKTACHSLYLYFRKIFSDLRHFIFILLLVAGFHAQAQMLKGTVLDAETHKPLASVTIVNLASQQSTYTDDNGNFALVAKPGEEVWFSFVGYHNVQKVTPPAIGIAEMRVEMLQQNFELQEFVFHGYTPYQRDSLEMDDLYHKELNVTKITPTVGFNNGVAVNGLIGSAVQKISRGYKKSQKFKKEFKKMEEDRFIDTRYTPELVASLTGFSGDSLAYFVNAYPMDYEFARTASDLELKMWIRYNYREYIHRKDTLQIADKARNNN